jgi:hypothetical protein
LKGQRKNSRTMIWCAMLIWVLAGKWNLHKAFVSFSLTFCAFINDM